MKEMDRIFRLKLNEHSSELPADMWSRIESGMNEKKSRKGFFWLPILGLGLLAVAISVNLISKNPKKSDAISTLNEIITPLNEDIQNIENQPVLITNNEEPSTSEEVLLISKVVEFDNQLNTLNSIKRQSSGIQSKEIGLRESHGIQIIEKIDENEHLNLNLSAAKEAKIEPHYNNLIGATPYLATLDLMIFEAPTKLFKDPIGCPSFRKTFTPNIFVETHFNPLYARQLLSSNSPEIGENYLDLRRNSENTLVSWSAGFNVGWISNYDVGLKTGVNYEVINERFEYQDPDAIRNQTIIVIDTFFNPDGSTTIAMDTSIVQVNGFEKLRIHNFHRSIDIPVHVLYQLDFDQLDFEISGGPNFNINYSNRGKIVDPNNEDQWFTNGQNGNYNVFKDRLSVSFSLSISAFYSINEKFQIYARPNFKIHPNSISNDSSPFNQKYANVGLAAGVRYYFFGNPNY